MPFDLKVLEDRIKKLEEVRRMLSDPEIVQLLLEILKVGQQTPLDSAAVVPDGQDGGTDEADLVIREVMESSGADPAAAGDSYWLRKKKQPH
jgi:hypothetical protein